MDKLMAEIDNPDVGEWHTWGLIINFCNSAISDLIGMYICTTNQNDEYMFAIVKMEDDGG